MHSPNPERNLFFSAAAFLGFLAVLAGAFGTHALKHRLSPEALDIFKTAAYYQMVHSLLLLFISEKPAAQKICTLFLAGIFIFSGSLYLLVFTGTKLWGAVTPIGGLCLLGGWLLLFFYGIKKHTN